MGSQSLFSFFCEENSIICEENIDQLRGKQYQLGGTGVCDGIIKFFLRKIVRYRLLWENINFEENNNNCEEEGIDYGYFRIG